MEQLLFETPGICSLKFAPHTYKQKFYRDIVKETYYNHVAAWGPKLNLHKTNKCLSSMHYISFSLLQFVVSNKRSMNQYQTPEFTAFGSCCDPYSQHHLAFLQCYEFQLYFIIKVYENLPFLNLFKNSFLISEYPIIICMLAKIQSGKQ